MLAAGIPIPSGESAHSLAEVQLLVDAAGYPQLAAGM